MSQFTFINRSQAFQSFKPEAFDSVLGQRVPIMLDGIQLGTGVITKAVVSESGHEVEFTVEIDEVTERALSVEMRWDGGDPT